MPNGPKRNANLRLNARFRVHFTHHVRKCARGLHLSLLIQTFPNVVLVSVSSIAALKRAYPNYFLDTADFLSEVAAITGEPMV